MWAVSQIMQFVYVNRARESAAGLAMTFAGQSCQPQSQGSVTHHKWSALRADTPSGGLR